MIIDQPQAQPCHIPRGGDVPGFGPAAGVDEIGVGHADRLRGLVHALGKGRLAARQPLGKRDGRIVARGDDQPAQQVVDRDPPPLGQQHGRATARCGFLADLELGAQRNFAPFERVEHQIGGHDLGHRRRRHRLRAVLLEQNVGTLDVDDHDLLRAGRNGQRPARQAETDCHQHQRKHEGQLRQPLPRQPGDTRKAGEG